MTTPQQITEALRRAKPFLKEKFHVAEIGLFGSYARLEQSQESDVDILVKFDKAIGWEFVDCRGYLEEILNKQVDLVTVNGLKDQFREQILSEVIYA